MTKYHCRIAVFAKIVILLVSQVLVLIEADSEVVEWVQRHRRGDFYKYVDTPTIEYGHEQCQNRSTIFFINQRKCVDEKELFRGNLISAWIIIMHCSEFVVAQCTYYRFFNVVQNVDMQFLPLHRHLSLLWCLT